MSGRHETGRRTPAAVPPFDRRFFDASERFTRLGSGAFGGKAAGLLFMKDVLVARLGPGAFPAFEISVPTLTVIATDLFDRFMEQNDLYAIARSELPDDRIAHTFQKADLPVELLGDLRALVHQVHTPLAVRSSSLLEDALDHPFAGVYATKMIPNNQPDADSRFRRLVEAIKFVYASTFFRDARAYLRAIGRSPDEEKMAVIVQEVVGRRHRNRFYPHVSGVARSYSFYRFGAARPEEGVANLALGLGKTIVDGGVSWTCSPAFPKAAFPYGTLGELLDQTQREFWAVNMGPPPAYDPIAETEYLLKGDLTDAEADDALRYVASTYDPQSDRLSIGIGRRGARAITFAPLLVLEELPLNALVGTLLDIATEALASPVEIEFAVTIDETSEPPARFGFLQVRPMLVSDQAVELRPANLRDAAALVASDAVMGNGLVEDVRDLVYVRPESFDARYARVIAFEIADLNALLAAERRPYVLIGFGRWGSTDPWLGIPVTWAQICGAKAIVEAQAPGRTVEISQGAHFFHNLSSFQVSYFSVRPGTGDEIDWPWLAGQEPVRETPFVRHVRTNAPLSIRVDGRSGRGVILEP